MSYIVTGAAAVVEMDDGRATLGTGRRVYLEERQAVPEGVKKASIEHLLEVGLIGEPAKWVDPNGKASSSTKGS